MRPATTTASRTATRLTVLGLLTALLVGAFALTGPAAQAAWSNGSQLHGGKVQVCKVALGDGRLRIKVRLNNTSAQHTHVGGLSRVRDFTTIVGLDVRARAGRTSNTKSLVWTRAQRNAGEWLSVGIGDTNGQGHGGEIGLSQIRVC
ncbi:hypothetical protein [Nocardioides sambongensis]|uniref:hypothetical protein n=1 Tax=Nocardioides sambongensis TaxID=2589074 RepID=UPI0011292824|nr:hypothetical protein [Nocardioides sambongensis]